MRTEQEIEMIPFFFPLFLIDPVWFPRPCRGVVDNFTAESKKKIEETSFDTICSSITSIGVDKTELMQQLLPCNVGCHILFFWLGMIFICSVSCKGLDVKPEQHSVPQGDVLVSVLTEEYRFRKKSE